MFYQMQGPSTAISDPEPSLVLKTSPALLLNVTSVVPAPSGRYLALVGTDPEVRAGRAPMCSMVHASALRRARAPAHPLVSLRCSAPLVK